MSLIIFEPKIDNWPKSDIWEISIVPGVGWIIGISFESTDRMVVPSPSEGSLIYLYLI